VYYPEKDHILAFKLLGILSKHPFTSTVGLAEKCSKKLYTYSQKRTLTTLSRLKEMDYCIDYNTVSREEHVCNFCKNCSKYFEHYDSLNNTISLYAENKIEREKAKKQDNYDPQYYFHVTEGYVLGRQVNLRCFNCLEYVKSEKKNEYKIGHYRYWSLSENGKYVMLSLLHGSKLYEFIKQNNQDKIFKMLDVLLHSQKKEIVSRLIYKIKQNILISPVLTTVVDSWYNEILLTVFKIKCDSNSLLYEYQKEIKREAMIILTKRR